MKVGAGILGILWGIFAFFTFSLFMGGLGALGGAIGNAAHQNTAGMAALKYVGLGLPFLALAGGVVSFGQGAVGGIMLLVSSAGIFFISHANFIGLVIAGPIAIAGVLAIAGQNQTKNSGT